MTANEAQPQGADIHNLISLRVAGAGARKLGDAQPAVQTRLDAILDDLASALPKVHASAEAKPARLTLLTGLADGADQCMAAALLRNETPGPTQREHVAVLPFDVDTYRTLSPINDKDGFDRLLAKSSTVIELDGRWLPDDPAEPEYRFPSLARSRAYRAQARLVLERTDLLLAVLNPAIEGRAGGTAETVKLALASKLPVLLLAFGGRLDAAPQLHLLRTPADWEALQLALGGKGEQNEDGDQARPASTTHITPGEHASAFAQLVKELTPLPLALPAPPQESRLEWAWDTVRDHFKRAARDVRTELLAPTHGAVPSQATDGHFKKLRGSVTKLNQRFNGSYRGGYLTNYAFAALATTLAALSLTLMVLGYKFFDWHDGDKLQPWLKALLIALAIGKLCLVLSILRTTHRARKEHWNTWATRTRHLAEHWRLMQWLPALGPLRSPRHIGQHHVEENLSHESVDALLRASVRNAPAGTGLQAQPGKPRHVRPNLPQAIANLQREWIATQHDYHLENQATMAAIEHKLKDWVEKLNYAVITFVGVDIALLAWGFIAACPLPKLLEVLKVVLVMMAASLPAVVAAFNGIRAQWEARRLMNRSKQLAVALAGLHKDAGDLLQRMPMQPNQPGDPGSWTLEALDLAERCASLVAEDVAEWSVLYSNEVPDT